MKNKSTSKLVRHSLGEGGTVPACRRLGEGGFFNLRILIGLLVVLAGVLLALLGLGTFSNASAQTNPTPNTQQRVGQMTVIPAVHSDLSPPLRDQPVEWPQARENREPPVHRKIPFKHKGAPDPVIQSSSRQPLMTPAIPGPVHDWAGIASPCHGCIGGPPPDTNGAVGRTQYVEMVNVALQVFDKLTGTSLLGPFPIDSVWFGFGGACEVNTDGDPVVVYDRLADRWIISQFATPRGAADPQDECIAVSQTGDATGPWYRYDFHISNRFPDYPKFGVWPDGYYMSANVFKQGCEEDCSLGPQPFVFDRAKMLVGDPTATAQTPGLIQSGHSFLPSDLDGVLPPPTGDPNHFIEITGEESPPPRLGGAQKNAPPRRAQSAVFIYKVWAFHVDWDQPAHSSFTLQASVPAARFTVLCPDVEGVCVPQKGETQVLDSLTTDLMFRNAYRRFPDGRESMLTNFTVEAHSVAGIRWFELQRALPGNWTVHQEKTYQPDSTWRWLGSIASDNQGNIALGFSASSATIFPQIRYAGRLATDPLGILSGEQHLFDGDLPQQSPFHSWGDYSDMTVDPVDDCTFYYTNEYYELFRRSWSTRIGYFKFAQCTPPQKGTGHFVVRFVCDPGAPVSQASVSINGFSYGATLADGTYDAVLPPGSHSYVVSNPTFATQTGTFTITNGQTSVVDVCLGGRAAVGDFNGDGHPDYVLRNTNTRQTDIWYLNNNVFIGSVYGPTLPRGWGLDAVADFNQDSHPDYALLNSTTSQTVIGYLSGPTVIGAAYGPSLPPGWQLVAAADFNGDGYPEYLVYNTNSRQTVIGYLHNSVLVGAAYGPTLPPGWQLVAAADFNGDGYLDYLVYNMNSRQTVIGYLHNNVLVGAAYGPTLPVGWAVVAAADFDSDGYPDYLLYKAGTRQTAIWYLNNNVLVNGAYGPTLLDAWSLIAP